MTYQFIKSCNGRFPLKGLCIHLGVSRSGYYGWLKRDLIRRDQEDKQLGDVIEAEFNKHRRTYGSRRLRDRLRQLGRRHGRRRISRLMAERDDLGRRLATRVALDRYTDTLIRDHVRSRNNARPQPSRAGS